jgi:FMN phosphatase YigB (HAD superfamily)
MRKQTMVGNAITFDFHNTLVHCDPWFELEVRTLPTAFLHWLEPSNGVRRGISDDALERAYRKLRTAIIAHGHELSAEQSLELVLAGAGISVDDLTIQRGVEELMMTSLEHAEPVAGAVDAVHTLAEAGVALGVVSSAVYDPFLRWALDRFGILGRFGAVVTSASSGYYKSRPEIYWETLAMLSASPRRSVHVGDSARFDVDGAARAGMRTVLLSDGRAATSSVGPDMTVSTLNGSAPALLDLFYRVQL